MNRPPMLNIEQAAERVLLHSLEDPRVNELVQKMLTDEAITKEQLYHTAFAQGVISALSAIRDGKLIPLENN
jgi:hypothetical protein